MSASDGHANIYGHRVDLAQPDEGDFIVDVIVIARAVEIAPDGNARDYTMTSRSASTGGIVMDAMLKDAKRQSKEMREEAMWGLDDDEDES